MAEPFSHLLNWYGLVDEGTVLCKDGSLIAGWYLQGIDTEPMDMEAIEARTGNLARAIKDFREEDGFWIDLARRPLRSYKTSEKDFDPEVLQIFERERAEYFEAEDDNYANRITLCYHWMPPKKLTSVEDALEAFKGRCRLVETRFSSLFELTRMGLRRDTDDHHEIEFLRDELLGRLASGLSGRFCKVNVPRIPVYLDRVFAPEWIHDAPQALPTMSGRPVAVIAIDGYPNVSTPEMLSLLESLPIEYQWTTRFLPMSKGKATTAIKDKQKEWAFSKSGLKAQLSQSSEVVNAFSENMALEAQEALNAVDGGDLSYGDFTSVITIFGNGSLSVAQLEEITMQVVEELAQQGFSARRETYNALEAFLSTLPGHRKQNVRRGIVSSINFADLIPISSIWSGLPINPCNKFPSNSPALLRAKSASGEPYFFNLHSRDVGHTMVFGATGAGKSVLLGLIASNFMKYPNAQVFVFDKMHSMYALTRAIGGTHIELGPDEAGLNPLGALPVLGTTWGLDWVRKICELSNVEVTTDMDREITKALQTLDPNSAAPLEELYAEIQEENVKSALAAFIKGGAYDGIVNAPKDNLKLSNFTVFEADKLIDAGESVCVAVLDYLFEMIEHRLKGAPSLIVLDEAWSFIGHPLFAKRIEKWLRELRKSNTSLLLATQFAGDAVNTEMADALLQNCKTRIFLPDPDAKNSKITDKYLELGLSHAQIDILTQMKPAQDYYVIKPEGRRIVNFCLGPRALSILGATDIDDSTRIKRLWEQDPDTWWRQIVEEAAR